MVTVLYKLNKERNIKSLIKSDLDLVNSVFFVKELTKSKVNFSTISSNEVFYLYSK